MQDMLVTLTATSTNVLTDTNKNRRDIGNIILANIKAETHDTTNLCDTSPRQVASFALILRQVAAIRHLFGVRNRFWKRGNVN